MQIKERFRACILGGAIGDAMGSAAENAHLVRKPVITYYNTSPTPPANWYFTDDTQLTSATCEALCDHAGYSTHILSQHLARYYQQRKITNAGATTLKALKELNAGIDWQATGCTGEYAAGNGAAMRMAPLAFRKNISRTAIAEACYITHRNSEAYAGALCVVLAIRSILENTWIGENDLFNIIIPQLPDTRLRDRMLAISDHTTIETAARLGTSGYVVDSVPFAVFAASQVMKTSMKNMYEQVIAAGGDTDTNASIAGQIAGALLGPEQLPVSFMNKLKDIPDYKRLEAIIHNTAMIINDY